MHSDTVTQTARAFLDGRMAFPEVVHQLITAGVEYYRVDYVELQTTFYSGSGSIIKAPINYEGLPPVAEYFDVEALRAIIFDSQHHHQSYRDFAKRAVQAGVQGYITFLKGKRVTYWGRHGDQHTEWFPNAKPSTIEKT